MSKRGLDRAWLASLARVVQKEKATSTLNTCGLIKWSLVKRAIASLSLNNRYKQSPSVTQVVEESPWTVSHSGMSCKHKSTN